METVLASAEDGAPDSANAVESGSGIVAADTVMSGPGYLTILYFHRTYRCETCILMEQYLREVIEDGFGECTDADLLRLDVLDYELPENSELYQRYGLEDGPALVLAAHRGSQEVAWNELADVWDLIDAPDDLVGFIEEHIRIGLDSLQVNPPHSRESVVEEAAGVPREKG